MDRKQLIACFQDTLKMCDSSALVEATEKAKKSTKVYKENFRSEASKYDYQARLVESDFITVCEGTSFATAKEYVGQGKIGVLNFANPHNPGGGVANGAMAQEECLCRSSSLYPCLLVPEAINEYYNYNKKITNNFFSDRVIYTDNVTVFKTDDTVPFLMPENEWFNVSVLTCAAPYIAKRKYTNKAALYELFKRRIRNIFEVALENHIQILVLGAFGCGAFKNPPEIVASAFNEVIKELYSVLQHNMKKIVFAIKSTNNNDPFSACPNITAFELEFYGISSEICKERFSGGTPVAYAYGDAVMPSGRIHKAGDEFLKYYEWKNSNKYFGKQFSILGDSISTLAGYNPRGYNVFYEGDNSNRADIHEMKGTWWGKVIDFFGGELLINNSWSGSRVAKLPNSDSIFPSACSDERTRGLHINGVKPDVIIVYLGTNDWTFGSELEKDWDENDEHKNWLGTILLPNEECFDVAYDSMLKKLKNCYPYAEIWCCTLNSTFISKNSSFTFPEIYNGNDIREYNDVIRECVRGNNCKLIDLYANQLPYDSIDGTHPNANGMSTLAVQIIRAMADDKGASFLDCEREHDYVLSNVYCDATDYRCKKCGKEKWEDAYGCVDINHNFDFIATEYSQYDSDYKYAPIDPNKTVILYDNTLKLFITSKGEHLEFKKDVVCVGKTDDCDVKFDSNYISRQHACFYFENSTWFVADTDSMNGVWLNGNKIEPKTKYELSTGDEIDIAHEETLVFYKPKMIFHDGFLDLSNSEIKIGSVIDDKYELLKQIGQGAFTKTYLAMDKRLNKAWATKICIKKNSPANAIEAMINEAIFVKRLNHPAIPNIIDIIDTDEYLCIVEDYINGATFEDILREYGAQPQEKVVEWTKQLCDVLGYLHSQNPPLIHRDIKPANIILKPDGNIALIDFGAMKDYKYNDVCDTLNLGTKGYAAPEQYTGKQTDVRTDVYGLGMTMHHLLTGYDPSDIYFDEPFPIRQMNPSLSRGLEYIVKKCVEPDPDKRYQTMQELRAALESSGNSVYASPDVFGSKLKKGLKGLFEKKVAKPTDKVPEPQKPEMKLVKCENGHFYNAAQYSECPHCKPYPFNKQNDIEDIPCVYASPDVMDKDYIIEDDRGAMLWDD